MEEVNKKILKSHAIRTVINVKLHTINGLTKKKKKSSIPASKLSGLGLFIELGHVFWFM